MTTFTMLYFGSAHNHQSRKLRKLGPDAARHGHIHPCRTGSMSRLHRLHGMASVHQVATPCSNAMQFHAPGRASAFRFLYCRALAAASSRSSSSFRAIDSLRCWLRSWELIAHGPRGLRPRPMGTPAPGASVSYIDYLLRRPTYNYGRSESTLSRAAR
jgi:hypothetical protein